MFGFLKLPGVSAVVSKVANLIPNPNARKKEQADKIIKIIETTSDAKLAQLKINAIEASHKSTFVAGWRPAFCWLLIGQIAWHFARPFIEWGLLVAGVDLPPLPITDVGYAKFAMGALTGMGGMRMGEKLKGIARN